jgi:hypothetical protein
MTDSCAAVLDRAVLAEDVIGAADAVIASHGYNPEPADLLGITDAPLPDLARFLEAFTFDAIGMVDSATAYGIAIHMVLAGHIDPRTWSATMTDRAWTGSVAARTWAASTETRLYDATISPRAWDGSIT